MSKLSLALATIICCAAPTFAAATDTTPQAPVPTPSASTAAAPSAAPSKPSHKASAPKAAKGNGGGTGSWCSGIPGAGVRLASVVAGSTIGMPIAWVRVAMAADVEHAKGMPIVGDRTDSGSVAVARIMAIPTAGWIGFISAPFYSIVNSWKVSADKPFSKENFALGAYDDSICPP